MLRLRGPMALALGLCLLAPGLALAPFPAEARWLRGDWHVHTTRSHDSCDPLTEAQECLGAPHTVGSTPEQTLVRARLRGLDYLAMTDHNLDPWQPSGDPGLALLGGYEASLGSLGAGGHAGVTGVERYTWPGAARGATPDERVQDYIATIHAQGGLFVVNHPRDHNTPWEFSDASAMRADAVEVWNTHWLSRDDLLPEYGANNAEAVAWWEGLLDQGARLAAVGGSDTHWLSTSAVQGVGQPATWVHAEASAGAVPDAVRAGRTFVSWDFTGPMLFLEGDEGCDGTFETLPGGTLHGAMLCVRVRTPQPVGLVRLRAGGPAGAATLFEGLASPLGLDLALPREGRTWVRADLLLVEAGELVVRALTSPLYLAGAP